MYTAKINDFKDDSMSTVVCQMIVCKISLVPSFGAQSIELSNELPEHGAVPTQVSSYEKEKPDRGYGHLRRHQWH